MSALSGLQLPGHKLFAPEMGLQMLQGTRTWRAGSVSAPFAATLQPPSQLLLLSSYIPYTLALKREWKLEIELKRCGGGGSVKRCDGGLRMADVEAAIYALVLH